MILISIHPEHVKSIIGGLKEYEFRKISFDKPGTRLEEYFVIYESSPTKAITMIIKKEEMIRNNINDLWNKCKDKAGITKNFFMKYYNNHEEGLAIKINEFITLEKPITLLEIRKDYPNFAPPQNYIYLSEKKYPILYEELKKIF